MKQFYDLFKSHDEDQVNKVIDGLLERRKVLICMRFGLNGYPKCGKRQIAKAVNCKLNEVDIRTLYAIKVIAFALNGKVLDNEELLNEPNRYLR